MMWCLAGRPLLFNSKLRVRFRFMENEEEFHTTDLTIEIDDNDVTIELVEEKVEAVEQPQKVFDHIKLGPPLTAQSAKLYAHPAVTVGCFPQRLRMVLSAHLNLPAFGTLRNWETVAANMGLGADFIMGCRSSSDPTSLMLNALSNQRANHFIDVLANINRVDTLISIRSIILKQLQSPRNFNHHIPSTSTEDGYSRQVTATVSNLPTTYGSPYIFVTHYEETPEQKKAYKWVLKNLRKHISAVGDDARILDVDNIQMDENWRDALQSAFKKATHVVVCVSKSYKPMLCLEDMEQITQNIEVRQHLHNLTNGEFLRNRSRNKRFRLVLLENVTKLDIPEGWPESTLQYRFPENAEELFKRLFSKEENEQSIRPWI